MPCPALHHHSVISPHNPSKELPNLRRLADCLPDCIAGRNPRCPHPQPNKWEWNAGWLVDRLDRLSGWMHLLATIISPRTGSSTYFHQQSAAPLPAWESYSSTQLVEVHQGWLTDSHSRKPLSSHPFKSNPIESQNCNNYIIFRFNYFLHSFPNCQAQ